MADHLLAAAEAQEDEIFVYMGGDQRVPSGVRRARIHKDVKIIPALAFQHRQKLISVEFHDGVEIIERYAFCGCRSLRSVKLFGVKIIKVRAFCYCDSLTDVECGDQLETIEQEAFGCCYSLRNVAMPSVRTIGKWAFYNCRQLTDLDLPEGLETLQEKAFSGCGRLERITMPLKDGMIEDNIFIYCPNLALVDLVGGIRNTIASLHLESWRTEMTGEIDGVLSNPHGLPKAEAIQQWMRIVISRLNHYKAEHQKMLKEATTLIELALWKANLDEIEGGEGVRTTRRQRKRARKEISITSGASIVIKNVLPYLELK